MILLFVRFFFDVYVGGICGFLRSLSGDDDDVKDDVL